MFTSSTISASGTNAARIANTSPSGAVISTGVRVRSHTVASRSGRRPSRAIANSTRVWPKRIVSVTLAIATQAPTERIVTAQSKPADSSTAASGASASASSAAGSAATATSATAM